MSKAENKLTLKRLEKEYLFWIHEYGNGRDKHHLRFGQYIHHKYELNVTHTQSYFSDGFYDETPYSSYTHLLTLIFE